MFGQSFWQTLSQSLDRRPALSSRPRVVFATNRLTTNKCNRISIGTASQDSGHHSDAVVSVQSMSVAFSDSHTDQASELCAANPRYWTFIVSDHQSMTVPVITDLWSETMGANNAILLALKASYMSNIVSYRIIRSHITNIFHLPLNPIREDTNPRLISFSNRYAYLKPSKSTSIFVRYWDSSDSPFVGRITLNALIKHWINCYLFYICSLCLSAIDWRGVSSEEFQRGWEHKRTDIAFNQQCNKSAMKDIFGATKE